MVGFGGFNNLHVVLPFEKGNEQVSTPTSATGQHKVPAASVTRREVVPGW